MTTVGDGLANEYYNEYGIKPIIITNASDYFNVRPSTVHNSKIRIIHHVSALRSRKIENMIIMIDHIDKRFTLDLMLIPVEKDYYT